MSVYLAALRDIPPRAVIEAVARYVRGEVECRNRAFAPSAPELANEARRIADRHRIEAKLTEHGGEWPWQRRERLRREAQDSIVPIAPERARLLLSKISATDDQRTK